MGFQRELEFGTTSEFTRIHGCTPLLDEWQPLAFVLANFSPVQRMCALSAHWIRLKSGTHAWYSRALELCCRARCWGDMRLPTATGDAVRMSENCNWSRCWYLLFGEQSSSAARFIIHHCAGGTKCEFMAWKFKKIVNSFAALWHLDRYERNLWFQLLKRFLIWLENYVIKLYLTYRA